MVLKIKINGEFKSYNITDAEICSEPELYNKSSITFIFSSINKIVDNL